MQLSENVKKRLDNLVESHDVVLFMKGRRRLPQCGFSAQVVSLLDQLVEDYQTVNVLESAEVREGIKAYSDWPTIPQLYVKGKFIGGCDIVTQMFENGDLQRTLGVQEVAVEKPVVTVTPAAREAFAAALEEAPGHQVRFDVDARFRPNLDLDTPNPGDFEVDAGGLTVLVSKLSAKRADGVTIDFVSGDQGGFKIDNPNEPPRVRSMTARELKERLDAGDAVEVYDVRPEEERALAQIDGTRSFDSGGRSHLDGLGRDATVVFVCHTGVRSRGAAEEALQNGFRRVYNLHGGIDSWSREVDPSVPRY